MDIKRFFAPSPIGNIFTITGEEFYHAVKTTRHKTGYLITVATGDGYDYLARITSIGKDSLTAEIIEKSPNTTEPKGEVMLMQGICKEFDFIVRKAVELGATAICPFYSERTNIKEVNMERLERIVREAAKQCGRSRLPVIHNTCSYGDALNFSQHFTHRLICYEEFEGKYIANAINNDITAKNESNTSTAIYIGSEGGFAQHEIDAAVKVGVKPVSLGKRILRAETAAIVALTLTLSALGEL